VRDLFELQTPDALCRPSTSFWRNPRGAVSQSLDCEGHAEAVSPTQTVSLGSPTSKVMPRTSACRYTSTMR